MLLATIFFLEEMLPLFTWSVMLSTDLNIRSHACVKAILGFYRGTLIPRSRLPRFFKYPDVDVYNQQKYRSSITFII